jgi:hypothetical protein
MIENYWMILAQVFVASFVLLFALTFIFAPFFMLLNNYKEKREKSEQTTIVLMHNLAKQQDEDYTLAQFLNESKNK